MMRGLDQVLPSSVLREKVMCWSGCASAELCVHTAISEPSGPSNTRKCSLPVSFTPVSVTSGTKTTKSGLVMRSCFGMRAFNSAGEAMKFALVFAEAAAWSCKVEPNAKATSAIWSRYLIG